MRSVHQFQWNATFDVCVLALGWAAVRSIGAVPHHYLYHALYTEYGIYLQFIYSNILFIRLTKYIIQNIRKNISVQMLNILILRQSLLTIRSSYVQSNDSKSQDYHIPAGVPKGSSLSAALYTIFTANLKIND